MKKYEFTAKQSGRKTVLRGRREARALTAEVFTRTIVQLVRSHQIHTVELRLPTESVCSQAVAGPSLVVVEALLVSALMWEHGTCVGAPTDRSASFSGENGSTLTYHITFRMPSTALTEKTQGRSSVISSDAGSPLAQLTSQWCAELQQRLAVCSSLAGLPVHLRVSLLPYVPQLSWDRDRDGLLGAVHSTTMVSVITESDTSDGNTVPPGGQIEVAVLLNAAIPLGPLAEKHTAVLFLYAVDGNVCFSQTLQNLRSRGAKKHKREWSTDIRMEGAAAAHVAEPSLFFLMKRFTEECFMPTICWDVLQSSALPCDGPHDICGLREHMGCSLYLQGALDARRVKSITIIVDTSLDVWHAVLSPLVQHGAANVTGSHLTPQHLRAKIVSTVEAALSRLVAENADYFACNSTIVDHRERTDAACRTLEKEEGVRGQTWAALVQSIADSLSQIVRSSQNPTFVGEVHRLLRSFQETNNYTCAGHPQASQDERGAILPTADSVATMLRWAVETRLMET
ncbi:hypothetical protein ERJ75_001347500 [Trypanosoma vivax]|uniref:Uncharacterized protein n=1 Tax=Trypanosoma vivax (strain Y486) TaxID=1055687 RepID=G0U5T0_TRYVY|nr:hypothetical protein TRVL_03089 [Trypanosoma vivax]KAH8607874.1 hypothetical protein ERJ75_001347500 [Trypanosoma vivax]CCC51231.1 conserved hypothetical protein [Trypanosoma vivax Y486]